MNDIILLTASSASSSSLLDLRITHTVIGALIALTTLVITQMISGRRERIKYTQTMLSWLVQSNATLFTVIFQISLKRELWDQDGATLRSELLKVGSFIYILPEDLKRDFMELYIIHNQKPEEYIHSKKNVHKLVVTIVEKLNKYGVKAFDH